MFSGVSASVPVGALESALEGRISHGQSHIEKPGSLSTKAHPSKAQRDAAVIKPKERCAGETAPLSPVVTQESIESRNSMAGFAAPHAINIWQSQLDRDVGRTSLNPSLLPIQSSRATSVPLYEHAHSQALARMECQPLGETCSSCASDTTASRPVRCDEKISLRRPGPRDRQIHLWPIPSSDGRAQRCASAETQTSRPGRPAFHSLEEGDDAPVYTEGDSDAEAAATPASIDMSSEDEERDYTRQPHSFPCYYDGWSTSTDELDLFRAKRWKSDGFIKAPWLRGTTQPQSSHLTQQDNRSFCTTSADPLDCI